MVECVGGGVPRAYQDGPLTLQDSPEKRTLRNSGLVPILLQKSLMFSEDSDSVAVMRFAVEASDDGAAQSRSKAVVLFVST
jgi:hypothetical protein